MKKLCSILAVICIVALLAGCSASDTSGQTVPRSTGDPTPTSGAPLTPDSTSAAFSPSPTTSQPTTSQPAVTREQAIELALKAAGLTREQVYGLEAEPDRERGGIYWEVEFETREHEYSYDIHTETGEIVRTEKERNDP